MIMPSNKVSWFEDWHVMAHIVCLLLCSPTVLAWANQSGEHSLETAWVSQQ